MSSAECYSSYFQVLVVLGMGTVVNKFASESGDQALQTNSILTCRNFYILLPMSGLVALVLLSSTRMDCISIWS